MQRLPRQLGQAAWLRAAGDGMAVLGKPHGPTGDVGSLTGPAVLCPPWGFCVCPLSPEQGKEASSQQKGLPSSIIL